MSTLYIRKKPSWINFITSDEINSFIEVYVLSKTSLVVGDYALWTPSARKKFLCFLESYPQVSVYSSININDPILLSRFTEVQISPLTPPSLQEEVRLYKDLMPLHSVKNSIFLISKSPLRTLLDVE